MYALLVGVALACLLTPQAKVRLKNASPWSAGLASALLLLVLAWSALSVTSTEQYLGLTAPAVVLARAGLIITAHVPCRASGLLSARPLVGLGLISYGVYLWSVPTVLLWENLWETEGTAAGWMWLVCPLTIVLLAWMSCKFIEMPVRTSSFRLARPAMSLLAGLGAMLAVAGMLFYVGSTASAGRAEERPSLPSDLPDCLVVRAQQGLGPYVYPGCVVHDPGPGRSATVLAVGNSVMGTLQPALGTQARLNNWRLLAVTVPGCPLGEFPPPPVQLGWPPQVSGNTDCRSLESRVGDILATHEVDLVVALDMTFPGEPASSSDPAVQDYAQAVFEKYRDTFAEWAKGRRILLILDFPPLDAPGTEDLRTDPKLDDRSRDVVERGVFLDESLDMLVSALPENSGVLSIASILCPNSWPCPEESGRQKLRYDQVHPTPAASHLVAPVVEEAIRVQLAKMGITLPAPARAASEVSSTGQPGVPRSP